jgi:5'-deoxynucleotidase YfbR-like HD superfamily hydrolase
VLEALLLHDAPEVTTGDLPAPVKRARPLLQAAMDNLEREWYADYEVKMPELTDLEMSIVKACDILDLGWACVEERQLGNRTREIMAVYANVVEYVQSYRHIPGVEDILAMMVTEWEALNV